MGISFSRGARDSGGGGRVPRDAMRANDGNGIGRYYAAPSPYDVFGGSIFLTAADAAYFNTGIATPASTFTLTLSAASNQWMDLIGLRPDSGYIYSLKVDGNQFDVMNLYPFAGAGRVSKVYDVYGYGRTISAVFKAYQGGGSIDADLFTMLAETPVTPSGALNPANKKLGAYALGIDHIFSV